jgi:RNA-dependent RNA polymerase
LHVLVLLVRCDLNADPDPDSAEPDSESENGPAEQLHEHYVREMRYIVYITHTLVDVPDVHLKDSEEEVVLGTILANCAQSRWRSSLG